VSALARVIRAELFKAVRKRRSYVLAGLWWVLLPVVTLIIARVVQVNVSGSFLDETGTTVASLLQSFASPHGLARVALTGPAFLSPTYYVIVVALLAAVFVGEEKSLNMWKTTLVAQPARLAVLWGKMIATMIVLAGLMAGALAAAIAGGVVGMAFLPTGWAGAWGELLGLYALQWAYLGAAVLFASLLIFLARNVALGIVMTFFLPALLEGLYAVWRTTVGFEPVNRVNAVFQALQLRETLENLPRWFFTDNLYLPARIPARELVTAFGGSAADVQDTPLAGLFGAGLTLPHAALAMAIYAALFGGLLTWSFLRRDVD
jgi:ABC-type transport system involved in multi-copper enzyme maturation permease subunit